MADQIRVIVVDDHSLFRTGVIQALKADKAIEVVGEGESGEDALQLVSVHSPDIALLDISMPGNGIETAEKITKLQVPPKVVMLTVSEADNDIIRAIETGAVGYLLKGIGALDLVSAIKSVAAGESFISPNLALRVLSHLQKPSKASALASLSPQEERTLRLVSNGLSNREVGEILGVLEKTVKYHMTKAMAKLGVRNRVEATLIARQEWGNG
jgi:two-component system nitrate/nitrite response regulator NarL